MISYLENPWYSHSLANPALPRKNLDLPLLVNHRYLDRDINHGGGTVLLLLLLLLESRVRTTLRLNPS